MYCKRMAFVIGMALTMIMGVSLQTSELSLVFAQTGNFTLLGADIKKTNNTLNANMTSQNEIALDGSEGAMDIAIISDKDSSQ